MEAAQRLCRCKKPTLKLAFRYHCAHGKRRTHGLRTISQGWPQHGRAITVIVAIDQYKDYTAFADVPYRQGHRAFKIARPEKLIFWNADGPRGRHSQRWIDCLSNPPQQDRQGFTLAVPLDDAPKRTAQRRAP